MMSNPRATRSRVSTPNASSESRSSAGEAVQTARTLLDRWVEPKMPTPRPSFADAGIMRQGVVQNMAPLGTLPTAKIMKAAHRQEGADAAGRLRRSGPSSVSTPVESAMTPEPVVSTPPTEAPRRLSTTTDKTEEPEAVPELEPAVRQETPQPNTPARTLPSRPSIGSQSAGQSVFSVKSPSDIPAPMSMGGYYYSPTPAAPSPVQYDPEGLAIINVGRTDRVVENAVDEAVSACRFPTAYALRTFYDDNRHDPNMVRLFEAVYNSRASPSQILEFQKHLSPVKHAGKKDRTAQYYFEGDGTDPAPPRPFSQVISRINPPAPGPYRTPYSPLPPYRPGSSEAQTQNSSVNNSSLSASASAPASASASASASLSPAKGENSDPEHEPPSKRHKGNNFQHSPAGEEANGTEVNGNVTSAVKEKTPPKMPSSEPIKAPAIPMPDKRVRSQSASSSSSLSSVDNPFQGEDARPSPPILTPAEKIPARKKHHISGSVSNYDREGHGPLLRFSSPYANASTFAAVASSAETLVRNQARPINAKPKTGPQLYTFATTSSIPTIAASSSHNNTTTPTPASTPTPNPAPSTKEKSPMAPAALVNSSSNTTSTTTTQTVTVSRKKSKGSTAISLDPEAVALNDKISQLKRKAREKNAATTSTRIKLSFERRPAPEPKEVVVESASPSDDEVSIAVAPSKRPPKVRLLNRGRETRGHRNYDSEETSSPTVLSFQPDIAPGRSISTSRAGTPSHNTRPTRKAKTGSGLRVKQSPMKKKGGTLAGIPRASGERNSPANGVFGNQDESDDYCSACGGNGYLICCDNCPRSFHPQCVDPPLEPEYLPDTWSCNSCQSKRDPDMREDVDGPFGQLLSSLEEKNPCAFRLPSDIREYFENVKTGTSGEYEEGGTIKIKHRNGYEETPDYFRLKDTKGKTILCHQCHGQPRAPDRAVVPCGFCGLHWHIDCLPNPLAKEPNTSRPWQCPAHVDDLLASLPEVLGPAHRFRKIKGAPVIRPAIPRGLKNSGQIEIENTPSDDEEEPGFYDLREYGHVYKLPEQGIKLDFIARVKQMGGGGYIPPVVRRPRAPRPKPSPKPVWSERNVAEQQAALNLAALSAQQPGLEHTSLLINTLLAEAPANVVAMIGQGQADALAPGEEGKLKKRDKKSLQALKALIESKLAGMTGDEDESEEEAASETEHKVNGVNAAKVGDVPNKTEDEDTSMILS